MKQTIGLLAVVVAALGLLMLRSYIQRGNADAPETAKQRDIYLISASGLRHSHLTSYLYQHSQTPAIDFLAYDGIRCLTAFSTATDGLSSHLSILTGLYPFHTSLRSIIARDLLLQSSNVTKEPQTLPALLRQKGYRTSAFVADPELRTSEFLTRQFDLVSSGGRDRYLWESGLENAEVVRLSSNWIRDNPNHPLLVLLNFAEPTAPFDPVPPYDRHYRDHLYDGEVAAIDEQIGKFINFLKKQGRYETSIIVFLAPFGESMDSQSRFASILPDNVRIPMSFTAPGLLPEHVEYAAAVSLVDVAPSIAMMVNLQLPYHPDGEPLFRRGTDQEIERNAVFGLHAWPSVFGAPEHYFVFHRGTFSSTTQRNDAKALLLLQKKLNARLPEDFYAADEDLRMLEKALIAAREKRYQEAGELLQSLPPEKRQSRYLRKFLADIESAGRISTK